MILLSHLNFDAYDMRNPEFKVKYVKCVINSLESSNRLSRRWDDLIAFDLIAIFFLLF